MLSFTTKNWLYLVTGAVFSILSEIFVKKNSKIFSQKMPLGCPEAIQKDSGRYLNSFRRGVKYWFFCHTDVRVTIAFKFSQKLFFSRREDASRKREISKFTLPFRQTISRDIIATKHKIIIGLIIKFIICQPISSQQSIISSKITRNLEKST